MQMQQQEESLVTSATQNAAWPPVLMCPSPHTLVLWREACDQTVKVTDFMKSQSLNIYLFSMLWLRMEVSVGYFCCPLKPNGCLQGALPTHAAAGRGCSSQGPITAAKNSW